MAQCHDFPVSVSKFHIIQTKIHPIGIWDYRLSLEGNRIEIAWLDINGLTEKTCPGFLQISDKLHGLVYLRVYNIPMLEFALSVCKRSPVGIVQSQQT